LLTDSCVDMVGLLVYRCGDVVDYLARRCVDMIGLSRISGVLLVADFTGKDAQLKSKRILRQRDKPGLYGWYILPPSLSPILIKRTR